MKYERTELDRTIKFIWKIIDCSLNPRRERLTRLITNDVLNQTALEEETADRKTETEIDW